MPSAPTIIGNTALLNRVTLTINTWCLPSRKWTLWDVLARCKAQSVREILCVVDHGVSDLLSMRRATYVKFIDKLFPEGFRFRGFLGIAGKFHPAATPARCWRPSSRLNETTTRSQQPASRSVIRRPITQTFGARIRGTGRESGRAAAKSHAHRAPTSGAPSEARCSSGISWPWVSRRLRVAGTHAWTQTSRASRLYSTATHRSTRCARAPRDIRIGECRPASRAASRSPRLSLARAGDRHVGIRIEALLLVARGTVLIARHAEEGEHHDEPEGPADKPQQYPANAHGPVRSSTRPLP